MILIKNRQKIEDFLVEWMTENKVPGMSVAIVKADEIIYNKGFGARDLKQNHPATPNTLYGIASCTKSFTSLGIMKLVERNILELDDSVSKYLPLNWNNDITIHSLLTNSSGMPSLGVSEILINRSIEMDEIGIPLADLGDFYNHLNNAKDEIISKPGKNFAYLNSGWSLLGLIIENVSEKSYPEFINDEILEPLEMERSTFEYDENKEDIMKPYFTDEEGTEQTAYPKRGIMGYPTGGLWSSVNELANYLIMNMNDGEFKGKQFIDKSLLQKMHTGQISRDVGEYGYGWAIKEFEGKKFVCHRGSIGVGGGFLGFVDDVGVALGANTIPSSSSVFEEVAKRIIKTIKGEDGSELTYFKRNERMDMLTGTYKSYRDIKEIEIEKEFGLLKLTVKEQLEGTKSMLIPESKTIDDFRFYYLDQNGEKILVSFKVKEDEDIELLFDRWKLYKTQ